MDFYRGNTLSDFLSWSQEFMVEMRKPMGTQAVMGAQQDLGKSPHLTALFQRWFQEGEPNSLNALVQIAEETARDLDGERFTSFDADNAYKDFKSSDMYRNLQQGGDTAEYEEWLDSQTEWSDVKGISQGSSNLKRHLFNTALDADTGIFSKPRTESGQLDWTALPDRTRSMDELNSLYDKAVKHGGEITLKEWAETNLLPEEKENNDIALAFELKIDPLQAAIDEFDLNGDGRVNTLDENIAYGQWDMDLGDAIYDFSQSTPYRQWLDSQPKNTIFNEVEFDLTGDGKVDIQDAAEAESQGKGWMYDQINNNILFGLPITGVEPTPEPETTQVETTPEPETTQEETTPEPTQVETIFENELGGSNNETVVDINEDDTVQEADSTLASTLEYDHDGDGIVSSRDAMLLMHENPTGFNEYLAMNTLNVATGLPEIYSQEEIDNWSLSAPATELRSPNAVVPDAEAQTPTQEETQAQNQAAWEADYKEKYKEENRQLSELWDVQITPEREALYDAWWDSLPEGEKNNVLFADFNMPETDVAVEGSEWTSQASSQHKEGFDKYVRRRLDIHNMRPEWADEEWEWNQPTHDSDQFGELDHDTDDDGIFNSEDTDDDNDGISDVNDAFPTNPLETTDTDGDGIGDNEDEDSGVVSDVWEDDDSTGATYVDAPTGRDEAGDGGNPSASFDAQQAQEQESAQAETNRMTAYNNWWQAQADNSDPNQHFEGNFWAYWDENKSNEGRTDPYTGESFDQGDISAQYGDDFTKHHFQSAAEHMDVPMWKDNPKPFDLPWEYGYDTSKLFMKPPEGDMQYLGFGNPDEMNQLVDYQDSGRFVDISGGIAPAGSYSMVWVQDPPEPSQLQQAINIYAQGFALAFPQYAPVILAANTYVQTGELDEAAKSFFVAKFGGEIIKGVANTLNLSPEMIGMTDAAWDTAAQSAADSIAEGTSLDKALLSSYGGSIITSGLSNLGITSDILNIDAEEWTKGWDVISEGLAEGENFTQAFGKEFGNEVLNQFGAAIPDIDLGIDLPDAPEWASNLWNATTDGMQQLGQAMADSPLGQVTAWVYDQQGNLVDEFGRLIHENGQPMFNAAGEALDSLGNVIQTEVIDPITDAGSAFDDTVVQPIHEATEEIIDAGDDVVDAFGEGVVDPTLQWLKENVDIDLKGLLSGYDSATQPFPSKSKRSSRTPVEDMFDKELFTFDTEIGVGGKTDIKPQAIKQQTASPLEQAIAGLNQQNPTFNTLEPRSAIL